MAYQPPASLLCLRVNTVLADKFIFLYFIRKTFPNLLVCQVPLYWLANKGIVAPLLEKAGAPAVGPRAEVKLILIFTSLVARPIDPSPLNVGEI